MNHTLFWVYVHLIDVHKKLEVFFGKAKHKPKRKPKPVLLPEVGPVPDRFAYIYIYMEGAST